MLKITAIGNLTNDVTLKTNETTGKPYATLNTYMPMWIAPILLVACFVFGLVGGVIGKAICKKHFQRAGIA